MYLCKACGAVFETPALAREGFAYPGGFCREDRAVCPACGEGSPEEARSCPLCDGWMEAGEDLCPRCGQAVVARFRAFLGELEEPEVRVLDEALDGVSVREVGR